MKRITILALSTLGALTALYGALWTLSLLPIWPFPVFEWRYHEAERKASPDGRFDAIVLRGNAGAVSGYQYEIYVLPGGRSVDRDQDRRHRIYGSYENSGQFTYSWMDSELHVTVEETPIDHFWPYYFTEDAEGRRKKEGRVFLHFRRD